jgi:hypothetical protein
MSQNKRGSESGTRFADNRSVAVTQRKLQTMLAGSSSLVIQRRGTVTEFMGGKVKLYVPEVATKKAAYYCHGVYYEQIDPVEGVSLGYLAPHKSTTSANASAVMLAPNSVAERDLDGKWHSYILSMEANASEDEVWLAHAEKARRAVAWVQSPTTTDAIVSALKVAGYSEILAVHCREVMGADNIDWDPETNAKIVVEQKGWRVERASMVGWQDANLDKLDETSTLTKGDIYYDGVAKKSRKVLNPDDDGKVRICTLD